MYSESDLIDKMHKVEALFSGAQTKGEKEAAQNALEKIQKRLKEYQLSDPPKEWKLTTNNIYERKLLQALLRRYGLSPFRYARQRHTTVMVRASSKFIDEILWPEFTQMSELLETHLEELTDKIIKEAINENISDEIREEPSQIGFH